MITQFVLARHATCAQMDEMLFGRVVDSPLDDHGRQQARALAERLASRQFEPVIYSSPRRRTRETASIIASATGGDVRACPQIDEIDYGRWSGRSFRELQDDETWREWNAHRSRTSTPAGETIAGVQARTLAFLYELAAAQPTRDVLLVTHSEIIRSIVMYCLEISPDHFSDISIDPASITSIRLSSESVRIATVNERVAA